MTASSEDPTASMVSVSKAQQNTPAIIMISGKVTAYSVRAGTKYPPSRLARGTSTGRSNRLLIATLRIPNPFPDLLSARTARSW